MSEPEEFPARPAADPSLPGPPARTSGDARPTGAADSWAAGPGGPTGGWRPTPDAPAEEPRGRRPSTVLAAVLALALIAGGGTYLFLRRDAGGGSGPATALALAFEHGDQTTYDLHMTMDGSVDMGSAGQQPLKLDVNESVGWKVLRVAKDGTATIRVSVDGVSGAVNGMPVPADASMGSATLRITPDGQIVDSSGQTLGSTSGPLGAFPGMDQVTPILPDHPVAPGDSWDKRFSQAVPFGDAKIEYTAHSVFERYEQVAGVRAAVITTSYEVPMRFSIDLGDLGSLFGEPGGAAAGKNATIVYDGHGSFAQTSWLDLASKQLVKGATTGTFDVTMTIPGLQAQAGTDHVSMSAEFSLDIARR